MLTIKTFIKCILFFVIIITTTTYAHLQHVHQYIVREGYQLLRSTKGDIPIMKDQIGNSEQGSKPWKTGLVVTGAWREDSEDPVYGYDDATFQGIPGVSASHFWVADNGDESDVTLRWVIAGINTQETVPSAYKKICRYAYPGIYGNWPVIVRFDESKVNSFPCGNPVVLGIIIEYDNLIDFFKTGQAYQVGEVNLAGNPNYCGSRYPVTLGIEWRNRIV